MRPTDTCVHTLSISLDEYVIQGAQSSHVVSMHADDGELVVGMLLHGLTEWDVILNDADATFNQSQEAYAARVRVVGGGQDQGDGQEAG